MHADGLQEDDAVVGDEAVALAGLEALHAGDDEGAAEVGAAGGLVLVLGKGRVWMGGVPEAVRPRRGLQMLPLLLLSRRQDAHLLFDDLARRPAPQQQQHVQRLLLAILTHQPPRALRQKRAADEQHHRHGELQDDDQPIRPLRVPRIRPPIRRVRHQRADQQPALIRVDQRAADSCWRALGLVRRHGVAHDAERDGRHDAARHQLPVVPGQAGGLDDDAGDGEGGCEQEGPDAAQAVAEEARQQRADGQAGAGQARAGADPGGGDDVGRGGGVEDAEVAFELGHAEDAVPVVVVDAEGGAEELGRDGLAGGGMRMGRADVPMSRRSRRRVGVSSL